MEKTKAFLLESDQLLHFHQQKKARILKVKEREKTSETLSTMLQLNDAEALCIAVHSRIDAGLDLHCFPDSQSIWRSINDTAELKEVV